MVNMIMYLCSMFTAADFSPMPGDKRPHLRGSLNNYEADFLVDTGAAVSVVSEALFNNIKVRHPGVLEDELPIPAGFRLSSAAGTAMKMVGCFNMQIRIHDRYFKRPFYIVRGLAQRKAILGIDFIRETQMVIEPDHIFFKEMPETSNRELATLRATSDFTLQARTALRTELAAKTARGEMIPWGVSGVSATAERDVGLWDTLDTVDQFGNVCSIVTNITDDPISYLKGEIVGFFQPLSQEDIENGVSEKSIDSIFNNFSKEPEEPYLGKAKTDLSKEEVEFMDKSLNIRAPVEYCDKYKDLCLKYHDVFSKSKFDIGRADVVEHSINLKEKDPIHVRQFRIPLEHRQTIYDWVDELLSKGAIEVSRSCFNTPIFLVPKPHGHGMRAVLDFRQINRASVPDRYTIREVRDCVDEIGMAESEVFSTIDLTSGFWQQSLDKDSRQYTAFTVPGKGTRYQWTVTPMGLQGSPASFARLIDYCMRGLKGVLTYIDDILSHAKTHEQHLGQLESVFLRLRKYGLKLNVAKSIFGADEVIYLGYTISKDGLRPGREKLKAVSDFKAPNNVRKIREFVGLANYFRFLIPDFAKYAGVLTNLTKKESGYKAGELPDHAVKAFLHLQKALVSNPIVAHPKPNYPYRLATDAAAGDDLSPGGFGAVLTQLWPDGFERVIAYASRTLKTNEKNYSAYLLEMAAVAWSIDHFSVYLQGRKFSVFTDHKPLETLTKTHSKTFNRLKEQMLQYDFDIKYKKGMDNTAADALSRNAVDIPVETMPVESFIASLEDDSGDLIKAQDADELCRDVKACLKGGELPNTTLGYRSKVKKLVEHSFLDEGVVWYNLKRLGHADRPVLLCPDSLKQMIMDVAHCSWTGGHSGKTRTIDRIQMGYYWTGMTYDVEKFLDSCIRCKELAGQKPKPSSLQSLPICEEPNFRVHMDLFGPLKCRSASGAKYIMVITDAFTKYTELVAIVDKKADTVALAFFEHWICRHGVPRVIVSDRGKEFLNSVMKDLTDFMGISHSPTSAYHPQSNAQAETYNKTMIRYLASQLDNQNTLDWEELLPPMMFCYNTHIHRATDESPFFLTYLHSPRLPYFDLQKPRKLYKQDALTDAFKNLRLSFNHVRDNLKDAQDMREQYFNRKADDRQFKVGQLVLVKFPQYPLGINKKFYKQWKGPYRVVRVLSRLNLKVALENGKKSITVHVDRVRALSPKDRESFFDSKKCNYKVNFQGKLERTTDIFDRNEDVRSKDPVTFSPPDDNFDQFVHDEDDLEGFDLPPGGENHQDDDISSSSSEVDNAAFEAQFEDANEPGLAEQSPVRNRQPSQERAGNGGENVAAGQANLASPEREQGARPRTYAAAANSPPAPPMPDRPRVMPPPAAAFHPPLPGKPKQTLPRVAVFHQRTRSSSPQPPRPEKARQAPAAAPARQAQAAAPARQIGRGRAQVLADRLAPAAQAGGGGSRTLTRAQAVRAGVVVEDKDLPKHCLASKRGRQT